MPLPHTSPGQAPPALQSRGRRSSGPRRALVGALLAGALAACGTTVPQGGGVAAGQPGQPGTLGGGTTAEGGAVLGGAPAPEAGAVDTAGTDGGGVGAGTLQPGGAGPAGTTRSGGTAVPSSGVVAGQGAGGVTSAGGPKKPVKIGFVLAPDADQFFSALGSSARTGNQEVMLKAALAWANANGGLAGHAIDPVIEKVSVTSNETYSQQYQKLCTAWTQDAKVVAASMVGIGADTNMDKCMNNAKTLFVTGSHTLHDPQDYARTPYVVSPHEVSAAALATTLADLIASRGYEKRGGTVGLLNYDIPEYNRAVDKQLKPRLAAAGIKLVQYTIPPPASTAAIGGSVSVIQNAQLRMAAQGVKTVTFLCAGCFPFFKQNAGSQNYYPRYVLSSMDGLVGQAGDSNDRALRESVAVGWEPVSDEPRYADSKALQAANPTFKRCLEVIKRTGQVTSDSSLLVGTFFCDGIMSLYAAARANPAEPMTATTLRDGFLSLKRSHLSALSHATLLTPSRHAGAATYRVLSWDGRAQRFAYSTPAQPFPDAR